jgi:hypothetical protein
MVLIKNKYIVIKKINHMAELEKEVKKIIKWAFFMTSNSVYT